MLATSAPSDSSAVQATVAVGPEASPGMSLELEGPNDRGDHVLAEQADTLYPTQGSNMLPSDTSLTLWNHAVLSASHHLFTTPTTKSLGTSLPDKLRLAPHAPDPGWPAVLFTTILMKFHT